jgi:hypothetical protein
VEEYIRRKAVDADGVVTGFSNELLNHAKLDLIAVVPLAAVAQQTLTVKDAVARALPPTRRCARAPSA